MRDGRVETREKRASKMAFFLSPHLLFFPLVLPGEPMLPGTPTTFSLLLTPPPPSPAVAVDVAVDAFDSFASLPTT